MNQVAARFPHFKTDNEVVEMCGSEQFQGGAVVFAVVRNMRDLAEKAFADDPKESPVAREDWKYKLAVKETLDKVLALPAQARTIQEAAVKHRREQ